MFRQFIRLIFIVLCVFFGAKKGRSTSDVGAIDSAFVFYNGGIKDGSQIKEIVRVMMQHKMANPKYIDILKEVVRYTDESKDDKDRIESRNLLSHCLFEQGEIRQGIAVCEEIIPLLSKIGQDSVISFYYGKIGERYIILGDVDKGFEYLYKGLKANEEFSPDESRYYNYLGNAYKDIAQYDSAIHYYKLNIDEYEVTGESTGIGDAYNGIGIVYYMQGKYNRSVNQLLKAQNYFESISDTFGMALVHNNIANNYKDLGKYELSETYYWKAMKGYQKFSYLKGTGDVYNNVALIKYHQGKYDSSLVLQDKSLEFRMISGNLLDISDSYINLGIVYLEQKKYQKAIDFYKKALVIKKQIKDKRGLGLCYLNLSQGYSFLKDRKKTESYAALALPVIKDMGSLSLEKDLYENLYKYYSENKVYSKALEYADKLIIAKDSLAIQGLDELNTQLELQEKEKELVFIEKERDVQELILTNQFVTLEKERALRNGLMLGIVVLLLFGATLFWAYRKNKNMNVELVEKQYLLELRNQDILTSKSYAHSMEKMLIQQMNPHFIFNALTTVQALINTKTLSNAATFIQTFSLLMRKTLDHSRVEAIPLVEEIDYLKLYIRMHLLKNPDEVNVQFHYDEEDVSDFVSTPPMLIQPFIENAFIHGLKHKTHGEKQLTISITVHEKHIEWTIEDNGVGRAQSGAIEKSHKNVSHGTSITNDRINWMKNIYQQQFSIRYEDLTDGNSSLGTRVILTTPIVASTET